MTFAHSPSIFARKNLRPHPRAPGSPRSDPYRRAAPTSSAFPLRPVLDVRARRQILREEPQLKRKHAQRLGVCDQRIGQRIALSASAWPICAASMRPRTSSRDTSLQFFRHGAGVGVSAPLQPCGSIFAVRPSCASPSMSAPARCERTRVVHAPSGISYGVKLGFPALRRFRSAMPR